MGLEGRKQRNALTAAEQALRALARRDFEWATSSAAAAEELDQVSAFAGLADAVRAAAADAARAGHTGAGSLGRVRAAVPLGPLHSLIDEL